MWSTVGRPASDGCKGCLRMVERPPSDAIKNNKNNKNKNGLRMVANGRVQTKSTDGRQRTGANKVYGW